MKPKLKDFLITFGPWILFAGITAVNPVAGGTLLGLYALFVVLKAMCLHGDPGRSLNHYSY